MAAMTDQERLEKAEQAYHDLQTGQMVRVFVDQNGERIEYTAAKKSDLYSYILQLRGRISPLAVNIPRPIGFFF